MDGLICPFRAHLRINIKTYSVVLSHETGKVVCPPGYILYLFFNTENTEKTLKNHREKDENIYVHTDPPPSPPFKREGARGWVHLKMIVLIT